MMTKKCSKCGEEKPLHCFYKQKTGKFGVISICKDCRRIYRKEYVQKHGVKEKINKRNKERYKIPEVRERLQKNVKKHRDKERNSFVERINKIVVDFINDE